VDEQDKRETADEAEREVENVMRAELSSRDVDPIWRYAQRHAAYLQNVNEPGYFGRWYSKYSCS